MAGPVLWGVPSIATESLMSLVARTATKNVLPSSHTLLSQVGAEHANNPTAALFPAIDEQLLATILRQPLDEISRRRHPPRPEPGFVDMFGVAVRADEIVFRRRRFGPNAIGTSAHARALWALKMVPCCTEHWQYLVDACACGTVQRWQSTDRLDRCDMCNAPLANAPAESVDPTLRDGLAFLIGLIDPDEHRRTAARAQLPHLLAGWDGGMVFELALALMPLSDQSYVPNRGHELVGDHLRLQATSLAQAADIVRSWPDSLIPALGAHVKARVATEREVHYKGLVHYMPAMSIGMVPSVVRHSIGEALSAINAAAGSTPAGQISMGDAVLLTGQDDSTLASARRAGQLQTKICLRANRLMPTLDRAEIEALHDFLQNRVGPDRASHQLHLPQYAMGQLAEEGLVIVNEHPFVLKHYGVLQIHAAELAKFRVRLWEGGASAASILNPVPLHRVARAIGGGPKPWGNIFRKLLDGLTPYSAGNTIDSISISARDAATFRLIDPTWSTSDFRKLHISQRDALEILNLPQRHAHLLRAKPTPGGAHQVSVPLVRQLAHTRITLTELSALTGIHGTRLESRLERDDCPRHDALGWIRSDALAKVASY